MSGVNTITGRVTRGTKYQVPSTKYATAEGGGP
jgi:hypothetical protein